tara:strand:- start:4497 stop:5678 length:1182 start_codon:yes stop_codon:yes gene_type:complete
MAEFNKGDLAEVILSAAVAARFKRRFRDLTRQPGDEFQRVQLGAMPAISRADVTSVLSDLIKGASSTGGSSSYNVHDYDKKLKILSDVTDNIHIEVAIPQKSWDYIKSPANWSNINNIFTSAISKVNGDGNLRARARALKTNLKYDTINIAAQGTKNQKGTKVDINISITSTDPDKQSTRALKGKKISLKYDAPQFAQSVGLAYENFGKIFGDLDLRWDGFLDAFESEVNQVYPDIIGKTFANRDAIKNSNEVRALKSVARKVFLSIDDQLDVLLTTNSFKEKLARYIINRATLNESGVELVKFDIKGGSKTQMFANNGQDFINNIVANNWVATMEDDQEDPKIKIHLKGTNSSSSKNMLIQFRYRTDAKKSGNQYQILMRSYVESGGQLYEN